MGIPCLQSLQGPKVQDYEVWVPANGKGGTILEVSLVSVYYRPLGTHDEVLCHSLLGSGGGPTWVMAIKWFPTVSLYFLRLV